MVSGIPVICVPENSKKDKLQFWVPELPLVGQLEADPGAGTGSELVQFWKVEGTGFVLQSHTEPRR